MNKGGMIRLAVDIGASGGKAVLQYPTEDGVQTQIVYRFRNFMEEDFTWDIDRLTDEVFECIKKGVACFGRIDTIGIDTWGVDYVLLDESDKPLFPVYGYRHPRTRSIIQRVHDAIAQEALYRETLTQFQPFNTIYQLACDQESGRLSQAQSLLMLPEYLYFRLTGVKRREYTNATTTGLWNPFEQRDSDLVISRLGFPRRLFLPIAPRGTADLLLPNISRNLGTDARVCLIATHDTASAVEGIDVGKDEAYLSSGTWSLFGKKVSHPFYSEVAHRSNFTFEGGLGYLRLQKNIMGLWILSELQKEGGYCSPEALMELARRSTCERTFDANHTSFIAPPSMRQALRLLTGDDQERRLTDGDLARSACLSLALSYQEALQELQTIQKETIRSLVVFGGGANNLFLNELIAKQIGVPVRFVPIEATAVGNLKEQERIIHDSI